MWDKRYSVDEYIYGKDPNDFLAQAFGSIPKGRVLSLGEGEGRNAVFLAERGYEVVGVDSSAVGLKKARALAQERGVEIETVLAEVGDFAIEPEAFDGIISIFLHLPPLVRNRIHESAVRGLRPDGAYILEAYTPRQLEFKTGGPSDRELLMELPDLKRELAGLEFKHAVETEREFSEGATHRGRGAVVQIIGIKRR
ncbi:MAG: class I SAM-dependent methyltransferase [Chitinivibrionia bacterium]|nr:class I SAM-dependent methyltransferase [Chitinivibrionia bacterium]